MHARNYLPLALSAVFYLLFAGQAAAAEARRIELTIDFGDGFQKRYTDISARADFTVLGVLEAAGRHPRGIKLERRGSGSTAFIVSIDEVANEGGGAGARNWRFFVNDELAKQGAGARQVREGDRVLWKFDAGD